jgi:site-specific recombinase XerD
MTLLAPSMQAYFTDRLIDQRRASPNTIAAYRHTFQLLLRFATTQTGRPPSALDISDLDAPLIASFLNHLQTDRGNTIQTRHNRLAAIHSLFAYLALHHPEHADTIARVLAIPAKRTEKNLLTYLTDPEVDALLAACDQTTWTGRRDHAMLALTIQTGLRISELITLDCQDITLGTGANVHTIGKGRKTRRTPLIPTIRTVLKAWLAERATGPDDPLFPTRTGTQLSRDAVEHRLKIPPGRRHQVPVAQRQAHHDAHAQAHRCNAPAARRERHHRDRPLARPRTNLNHEHLPARRHDPQTTSDRPHQTDQRQTRPLPAHRHAPRVPASTLIMPTYRPQKTL